MRSDPNDTETLYTELDTPDKLLSAVNTLPVRIKSSSFQCSRLSFCCNSCDLLCLNRLTNIISEQKQVTFLWRC